MTADESQSASPHIVVYAPMRPPGGSTLRVVGAVAAFGIVLLFLGLLGFREAMDVGTFLSVICVPIAGILFFRYGAHMGPLVRRLYPYQKLDRPRPGEYLPGHVPYNMNDHLASVLFNTKLPLVGSAFLYSTVDPDHWRSIRDLLTSRGLPVPRSIVDERLKEKLVGIPLTQDLLEPEPVVAGVPVGGHVHLIVAAAYMLFALWLALSFGKSFANPGWLMVLIALGFLASTPQARRLLRSHRWNKDAEIVGCGVIKSPNNKRWTSDDAIMFVHTGAIAGGIHITIFGESGMFQCGFGTTTDEDFITLWQRWNHLDPQPHLLE